MGEYGTISYSNNRENLHISFVIVGGSRGDNVFQGEIIILLLAVGGAFAKQ